MADLGPSFRIQVIVKTAALLALVGGIKWYPRRDREEFSVLRVFGVVLVAMLISLPFIAAFWWTHDSNRHSPFLLAAWCVPIFTLEAWGIITFIIRNGRKKKRATGAGDGSESN